MVKPALPYLDVSAVRASGGHPSGRVPGQRRVRHGRGGGANGWIDERPRDHGDPHSIPSRRRGYILTYWAVEAARALRA